MHSNCPEENLTFFLRKSASISDLEEKDFRLSVKMLFGRLVKTAFNLSRKNFSFFRKIVLFKSFSLFNETYFGFLFKNFKQVCQNWVFCVQRNILWNFCRKKTLSILDIISTMAEFSRQAWQNWILSVHGNFLKEFDSAKKNFFFHGFRTSGETNETFWRNFFSRIVKTASSGSGESLWWNTFLEEVNFYYHFGTLREKMSAFWQKIFNRVSTVAFYVSRKTFWRVFLGEIIFLKLIWSLSEKNSDLVKTFSAVL